MDAAEPRRRRERAKLRRSMERRRRSRSGLGDAILRLLGLELKLRQYRLGRSFADAVVRAGGIETLNRAWDGAESLPTLAELERPGRWLERVSRA
jgi:uncharacterized protein (DUF2342 family)